MLGASRLQEQLGRLAAQQDAQDKAAAIAEQLSASGDAFELAARCAEGAWAAREKAPIKTVQDPTRDAALFNFELGYRVAAAELACILRAMRRGSPPNKAELAACCDTIAKQIEEE